MGFTRNRGNGGTYDYFMCLGRQNRRTECELPFLPVEDVEDAIEAYYGTIQLDLTTLVRFRTKIVDAMRGTTAAAEREARRQRSRIVKLEAERRTLLDAHLAGAVPIDLLKEQQSRITSDLANAGAALANTEIHWENVERNAEMALRLLADPQAAYRAADPMAKRALNQAISEAIHLDTDGSDTRGSPSLSGPSSVKT